MAKLNEEIEMKSNTVEIFPHSSKIPTVRFNLVRDAIIAKTTGRHCLDAIQNMHQGHPKMALHDHNVAKQNVPQIAS